MIAFPPSTSARLLRVYQALPHAIAAFAFLTLFTPAAQADGWKFNTKDSTKYFDANEKRPVHLLLRTDAQGVSALMRAELTPQAQSNGLSTFCAMVFERPKGGFFGSANELNVYYINLSRISSVQSLGRRTTGNQSYGVENTTLTDGTVIETVSLDTSSVYACGVNEKKEVLRGQRQWDTWRTFSLTSESECTFDATRIDRAKWPEANLDPAMSAHEYETYLTISFGGDRSAHLEFQHDEAALAPRYAACAQASSQLGDLRKRQAAEFEPIKKARDEEAMRQSIEMDSRIREGLKSGRYVCENPGAREPRDGKYTYNWLLFYCGVKSTK